jgi:hypothetical protein
LHLLGQPNTLSSPDEPGPRAQFYALARTRAQIERHRPGKLAFVNLLPNYAFPRHGGGGGNWSSYKDYVDFYIAVYRPQVLSHRRWSHSDALSIFCVENH